MLIGLSEFKPQPLEYSAAGIYSVRRWRRLEAFLVGGVVVPHAKEKNKG